MQDCRKGGCRALLVAVAVALPCAAWAQTAEDKAAILKAQWTSIFLRVTQARNLTIVDNRLTSRAQDPGADQEAVRAAYQEVIDRLLAEPALRVFFDPDDPAVATISRPGDREWIARLAASGLDGKAAKSVNAAATNPAAARVAERSGFSDFIALAMDARNVFAASQTAVSLNLNAVALVGLKSADVYSAPEIYRQHGALRRLGGTVTFGAKVPESELTGFTGFPSTDTLLDVFAWDVKYRALGDRDPRADRWHREMLGTLGGLTELSAGLITLAPFGDLPIVQGLLNDQLGAALARVKALVGNSLQVSVKAAGRHLTTTTGKSRYSAGILADKGLGDYRPHGERSVHRLRRPRGAGRAGLLRRRRRDDRGRGEHPRRARRHRKGTRPGALGERRRRRSGRGPHAAPHVRYVVAHRRRRCHPVRRCRADSRHDHLRERPERPGEAGVRVRAHRPGLRLRVPDEALQVSDIALTT